MPDLQIPILHGERVQLVPLAEQHSPGMFALWKEFAVCEHSGPGVDSRGRPITLPARTHHDSDRLLEYWLERAAEGTGFRWAVILEAQQAFVGAIGFNSLGPCSEFAYHFVPRFWGVGLATEGSRLALTWSFSREAEQIEFFIEAANTRSVHLATRLGFTKVRHDPRGIWRYSLSRADHTARP